MERLLPGPSVRPSVRLAKADTDATVFDVHAIRLQFAPSWLNDYATFHKLLTKHSADAISLHLITLKHDLDLCELLPGGHNFASFIFIFQPLQRALKPVRVRFSTPSQPEVPE